jgi:uncharacterized OB-fold protein
MKKTQPQPTPLCEPYWDGCREGELRLQRCAGCGRHQFYPRIFCSHCGSRELTWEAVSGRGVVASFTVIRRAISPAYEAPYAVALIDLAEGPRMMAALVDLPVESLRVGLRVAVAFEAWDDVTLLPVFKAAVETGEPE